MKTTKITQERLADFKGLQPEIEEYLDMVPDLLKYHFDESKVSKTKFNPKNLSYTKKVKANNEPLLIRFAMEDSKLIITTRMASPSEKYDNHLFGVNSEFSSWSLIKNNEHLILEVKHDYFYIIGGQFSLLRELKAIEFIENSIELFKSSSEKNNKQKITNK